MTWDDTVVLLHYNQWANDRLMRKAAHASVEQLSAPCWLSHGSLLRSLVHLADTEWAWREAAQTGIIPTGTLPDEQRSDVPALRRRLQQEDQALIDYLKSLSETELGEPVEYRWGRARPRRQTRWQILMHILVHSVHHRAEIGRYMATIGRSPGDMDFLDYITRTSAHPDL